MIIAPNSSSNPPSRGLTS
uniref:Uncharacterized protein n=1 Tax=Anguilla anguilla TaxID=7936 RepID=A0A0E9R8T6_ANGAN